jgi:hypothetical protein
MRAFASVNPRSVREAVTLLKQNAADGRVTAIAGGGSDLLGMVNEHLVAPRRPDQPQNHPVARSRHERCGRCHYRWSRYPRCTQPPTAH